jgi:GNAT superfamily N-acetyltransferase
MDNEIMVEAFKGNDLSEIVSLVTTAMLNNPLHVAVFGSPDEPSLKMQQSMFDIVLRQPQCKLHVAKKNNQPIGVMNYYMPGQCQLSVGKTIMLLPELAIGVRHKLPRVLRWKTTWGKHDAKTPHLHFGPLAVLPTEQGKGVGSALLRHFCQIADTYKHDAYLETDKNENLKLYERFGFRIVSSEILFGVRNWFMLRRYQKLF